MSCVAQVPRRVSSPRGNLSRAYLIAGSMGLGEPMLTMGSSPSDTDNAAPNPDHAATTTHGLLRSVSLPDLPTAQRREIPQVGQSLEQGGAKGGALGGRGTGWDGSPGSDSGLRSRCPPTGGGALD